MFVHLPKNLTKYSSLLPHVSQPPEEFIHFEVWTIVLWTVRGFWQAKKWWNDWYNWVYPGPMELAMKSLPCVGFLVSGCIFGWAMVMDKDHQVHTFPSFWRCHCCWIVWTFHCTRAILPPHCRSLPLYWSTKSNWILKFWYPISFHICSFGIFQVISRHHRKQSIYPIHLIAVLIQPIALNKIFIGTTEDLILPRTIKLFACHCWQEFPLAFSPLGDWISDVAHFFEFPREFHPIESFFEAIFWVGWCIMFCGWLNWWVTTVWFFHSYIFWSKQLPLCSDIQSSMDSCLAKTDAVTETPLSIAATSLLTRSSFFPLVARPHFFSSCFISFMMEIVCIAVGELLEDLS